MAEKGKKERIEKKWCIQIVVPGDTHARTHDHENMESRLSQFVLSIRKMWAMTRRRARKAKKRATTTMANPIVECWARNAEKETASLGLVGRRGGRRRGRRRRKKWWQAKRWSTKWMSHDRIRRKQESTLLKGLIRKKERTRYGEWWGESEDDRRGTAVRKRRQEQQERGDKIKANWIDSMKKMAIGLKNIFWILPPKVIDQVTKQKNIRVCARSFFPFNSKTNCSFRLNERKSSSQERKDTCTWMR